MRKEKDTPRCTKCGGELEEHPLLRDTRVCRCCEIEFDRNNQRIDWAAAGSKLEQGQMLI